MKELGSMAKNRIFHQSIPYHQSLGEILSLANNAIPNSPPQYDTAGAGYQGVTHTERGLTFVTVNLAGQYVKFPFFLSLNAVSRF
jgi:hypothetical protein